VTRAEFDDRSRPIRQTLANGEVREQVYDEFGRVVIDRQVGGVEPTFEYDSEHRLITYDESFEEENTIVSAR
jgi:YD repeat-containing protein